MISSLYKLGLGTGQFGLDQPPGARGRPREAEAKDILSIAGRSGLSVLDIAGRSASADKLLRTDQPQPIPISMTQTTIRPDPVGISTFSESP